MRFLARPLVLGGIMLLLLLGATGSVVGRAGPARDVRAVAARAVAGRAVARSPLAFQPEGASRFVARTPGHGVAVSPDGATLSGVGGRAPLQLHLVGANPDAAAEGRGLLAGRASQFLGDDPSTWRTDVATYGEVAYAGVWRGVDVVWHGRGSNLEQDFVVAPGGDADRIRLSFPGARSLRIVDGGALVVTLADSEARFGAPTLYQDERGGRRDVAGGFIVRPGGTIGFRVGTHDVDRPVVIDPVLVESTFLGGGGNDAAFGVAVDAAGSVYVTGSTESVDFPVAGSVQSSLVQVGDVRLDAFVTKLKPDGSAFVYSTFLGGRGRDVGYAIAVAADGSATVSGSTESTDFPLARPVQKAYGGGATDAFVTRLSPQGAVLQFSTYLGGGGADLSRGVAVDASGRATLVGTTNSNDFPTAGPPLQGAPNHPDDIAAFVTRLDADGSAWVYSTYVGGSGDDRATAVAVDAAGDAYVTGETQSPDFPTVRPLQASPGSPPGAGAASADAFAIKLAPAGSPLLFATYLGGSAVDRATGVAVDPAGAAYVTGSTGSSNFPSVRALQPTSGGGDDAFVAKIDPAGTSLVWSTFLGGSAADAGAAIAVTADGRASVTGASSSGNFPTAKPVRRAKGGFLDAFVATFAPSGGTLSESTYLGGSDDDHGTAIASDRSGTLYLAGYTTSADFPLVSPIRTTMGRSDAFLASVGEPPAATSSGGAAAPARERRIRLLGAATVVLFLAAIAQTLWLRHRGTPAAPDPATSVPPLGVVPTPQADPQWYAPAPPRLSDLPPLRPRALPPPAPRRGRKASSAVAQKSAGPDEPRGDVAVPDLFPAGEDDNWSREGQPDDTEFWSTDGAFREADDDHRPPLSVDVQAPDLWGADEIEVTNVVDDAVVAGAGSPPATVDVSAPDLWGPAEPEQETTIDPMWAELLAKPGTAAPPTAQPAASPPPATPPEAAPPIEPTPAAATPPEATSGEVVDAPASPPPKQKPKRRTRPRPEPAPAAAPVPSEPVGGEQPPVASGDWMAELWPVASPEAEEAVAVPGDAPAAEAAAPAGADEVESESPPAAPVEEVRRGWRARRRAAADGRDRRPPSTRERSPSPPPVSSEPTRPAIDHAEAYLVDAATAAGSLPDGTELDWEAPVAEEASAAIPPPPPVVPTIPDDERQAVEAGLADLVTNVDPGDLPPAPAWTVADFDGPVPDPHQDPELADALARELSISDLLAEDLPIPESASGADELSLRDLLAEDLDFTDAEPPAVDQSKAPLAEPVAPPPPELLVAREAPMAGKRHEDGAAASSCPAGTGEAGTGEAGTERADDADADHTDADTDTGLTGDPDIDRTDDDSVKADSVTDAAEGVAVTTRASDGPTGVGADAVEAIGADGEDTKDEGPAEPTYPKLPEAGPGRWGLRSGWGRPRR